MPPKPVQVAFRVYPEDWGMTRGHGSRQIDWLIDGKLLHKDNVLFVIDKAIPMHYLNALDARYRVYDASSRFDSISFVNKHRWTKFLTRFRPKHWVSYNDFHPRHRVRNAILRAAGCQTWHYSHSVNLPHVYGQPSYPDWYKLEYDHLILWNRTDAAAFMGGAEHILGPLFSSQVPHTVVAVFDSTWDHYRVGTRAKFFDDLFALLDRHPGMVMLYKPKWKPPLMFTRRNFYTLPEWIEPGLVIGCAMVTIGLAYTSPVIEAQGAGREAFWYDPWKDDLEALMKPYIRPALTNLAADRFRELLLI